MKTKLLNLTAILLFIIVLFKRDLVTSNILLGMDLWSKQIFPNLFPIFIISDFIISTNVIEILSKLIGPIFNKLFKISKYASYVFFMSMISGCPSNAKYVNDLLDNNLIEVKEASKILAMSLLYNPLLILALTSFLTLKDQIFIILINIIINLIIGLMNRNYQCNYNNYNFNKKNFNLINSMNNSINTLFLILASIVTFSAITALLPINHPLLTGIFEITAGLNNISLFNFKYQYILLFTGILLSFGGLSIHVQIKSILKKYPIDYSLFYRSRIIHLVLYFIFIYIYLLF